MVAGMPTKLLVIIVIALLLIVLGLIAVGMSGGMAAPVLDEIAKMLGGLGKAGG